jgi:hypothetical protein
MLPSPQSGTPVQDPRMAPVPDREVPLDGVRFLVRAAQVPHLRLMSRHKFAHLRWRAGQETAGRASRCRIRENGMKPWITRDPGLHAVVRNDA